MESGRTRSTARPSAVCGARPRTWTTGDDSRCLPHDQGRGGGELVGKGNLGGDQDAAVAIRRAAEIDQRRHAADPDRRAGDAQPPGAAEAVVDDDAEIDPQPRPQAVAQPFGAGIGVLRQQQHRLSAVIGLDVRCIDACIRHHHAMAVAHDEDAGNGAEHLLRFTQNQFDQARVLLGLLGELTGFLGGGDVVQ